MRRWAPWGEAVLKNARKTQLTIPLGARPRVRGSSVDLSRQVGRVVNRHSNGQEGAFALLCLSAAMRLPINHLIWRVEYAVLVLNAGQVAEITS